MGMAQNKAATIDSIIVTTLKSRGYSADVAKYWNAVAKYETDNYTSILCTYHNNLWGMSYFKAGKRSTLCDYRVYHKGKPTQFAGFRSKHEAVFELVLWLKSSDFPKHIKTPEAFVMAMKARGYFEEPFAYYMKGLRTYL